jgi:hypothetical protein
MNVIDSEGEERFKPGMENVFGSERRFFESYSKLYDEAIPRLRKVLRTEQGNSNGIE